MRTVKPTLVACGILKSTNILSIEDGKSDNKISCQSNLIQCDDGTCIAYFSLCNFNNQCYINELARDNGYLCFPSCMPGNCPQIILSVDLVAALKWRLFVMVK